MAPESLLALLQTLPDISEEFADPDEGLLPLSDVDLSQASDVVKTPGVFAPRPSINTPPQPTK